MVGTLNRKKTVRKSMHFWKHGKHRFAKEIAGIYNQSRKRYLGEMYSSIQEAMKAARDERKYFSLDAIATDSCKASVGKENKL